MLIDNIDFSIFWAWFLLFMRFTGVLLILPGIGSDQIPGITKLLAAIAFATAATAAGHQAVPPETLAQGGLMVMVEFILGFVLALLPAIVIGGISCGGQASAGVIGLAHASMIDPSLGETVSVIARLQVMLGTIIFLALDGHHAIIRAASATITETGLGLFHPDMSTAEFLIERFRSSFELGMMVAGPIFVTILVAKFILGLITKFVPQINVFIIALPLTIFLGLYVTVYSMSGFSMQITKEFARIEESAAAIVGQR